MRLLVLQGVPPHHLHHVGGVHCRSWCCCFLCSRRPFLVWKEMMMEKIERSLGEVGSRGSNVLLVVGAAVWIVAR